MIAIPNVDKPKGCIDCLVNDMACELWTEVVNIKEHRHNDCPLIEIEEWNSYGHGKMYAPKGTFQKILDDERRAE